MTPGLAHLLTCLYPRRWRERYGAEFEAFLLDGKENIDGNVRIAANVVCSAFRERIFPTQGGNMDPNPNSFRAIVRQPSAFVPMAMSLTGMALVVGHVAIYGIVREADEGATAHIWQLLMGLQLPVLVFFAVKWLPRAPKPTLGVLALQAGAALASMAPVFFFNL
jgi:hypothetical protein